MEAWPFPPVPRLPGAGLPLRLFDTASSEVRATNPGWQARMYVCGITPYDATHLGHAFTYLAFDLVNRVVMFRRGRIVANLDRRDTDGRDVVAYIAGARTGAEYAGAA